MRRLLLLALLLAPSALATPTLVAAGTSGFPDFGINPPIPAGIANNDILVLAVSHFTSGNSVTVSGYTLKQTYDEDTTHHLSVFWKRTTGTESAPTVACSTACNTGSMSVITAWRGVITTGDPFDTISAGNSTTTANPFTVTGVTTGTANTMLVVMSLQNGARLCSSATGATTTLVYTDNDSNGTASTLCVFDDALAAAGASGTTAITESGSITNTASVMAALIDAAGGGATVVPTRSIMGVGTSNEPDHWRRPPPAQLQPKWFRKEQSLPV